MSPSQVNWNSQDLKNKTKKELQMCLETFQTSEKITSSCEISVDLHSQNRLSPTLKQTPFETAQESHTLPDPAVKQSHLRGGPPWPLLHFLLVDAGWHFITGGVQNEAKPLELLTNGSLQSEEQGSPGQPYQRLITQFVTGNHPEWSIIPAPLHADAPAETMSRCVPESTPSL